MCITVAFKLRFNFTIHFYFFRYIAVFDQDEVIINNYENSQMKIYQNNFNFSKDKFFKNINFKDKKTSLKNNNFFDFITHIKRNYSKDSGSLYFKNGWYVNQSVIASFCSCLSDVILKQFNFASSTYFQKDNQFGFKFQIRNNIELNYMKFLCEINNGVISYLKNVKNEHGINDFYRFFYILFDSGGKSVSDTNKVFTVITHSPLVSYFIHNSGKNSQNNLNNTTISFEFKTLFNYVNYEISHMQHFKKNLVFLTKENIFPSLIGFDINYFDILTNSNSY